MEPFDDRNMFTDSGMGNKDSASGDLSDEKPFSLCFRFLLWPFRFVWHFILKPVFNLIWSVICGILIIIQGFFWFGLVVGGILYFTNDSFHAYANQNYLMRKAEFKLSFFEPLPDDWGRKEYMSIAAMEADKMMLREREKFYASLPLARKDYVSSVRIDALLDRDPEKLEKTVAYKGKQLYEVYCHFGANLDIYKTGGTERHHNFGYLQHEFRVWLKAVPPKERNRFSYGKYSWEILKVDDACYKPEDGFDKAVRLYNTYVFPGDK